MAQSCCLIVYASHRLGVSNAGILGTGEVFTDKLVKGEIPADEQEGVGVKVQEVCAAGRRKRAQKELPWRALGARLSRLLCGVYGSADDGDAGRESRSGRCFSPVSPGIDEQESANLPVLSQPHKPTHRLLQRAYG
jgi:hypothetical protein